jgi:beta-mannosidase
MGSGHAGGPRRSLCAGTPLRCSWSVALASGLLLLARPVDGAGLADPRIAGQLPAISLDGQWRASSADGSLAIEGEVPGDLITDLQRAGRIGDPLYELNWKDPKNVPLWNQTWTYTRTLPATSQLAEHAAAAGEVLLVFDGIKMGATIKLNGEVVGVATDQFVKYNFSIAKQILAHVDGNDLPLESTLEVSFDRPTNGRFMACSGGWDWGPYSNTYQNEDHTLSFGISKHVYILPVASKGAVITDVVPEIFYNAPHPITRLADGQHAGFTVRTRVYLWSPIGLNGKLRVSGTWGAEGSAQFSEAAGVAVAILNMSATAQQVKLWWPNGKGSQSLYNLTATLDQESGEFKATRSVGFRVMSLVTTNDTDATEREKDREADGSGSFGVMWRINGEAIWSKGANMIP